MIKSKRQKTLLASALAFAVGVTAFPGGLFGTAETAEAYSMDEPYTGKLSNVTVHDPSIVRDPISETYYAFGSHILEATSSDLVSWKNKSGTGAKAENNLFFGNLTENLAEPFAWAGDHDVDSKGGYSIWAPDVIYNPEYVNDDGTKGAWMMFFCTTSTAVRSVIAYGVSDTADGIYKCKGCLVYSGFSQKEQNDKDSKINKCYTNTNIDELIADGTLKDGFDANNWVDSSDQYKSSYGPNAIDPNVFFDKSGKMWMSYGSWSGGIYILEMDPATGKVKYPGKTTTKNGLVVDQYFGTRIAGGEKKSGEGPYIIYDKETDYYYLYTTYNWLGETGGYNMRLFRSKNPDGPYSDAAGNNAAYQSGYVQNKVGIKVMGNYNMPGDRAEQWAGYRSPGHNSALIDSDGQRYLVYHTRYGNNGDVHNLRVHQQFMNAKGWPVTAVYENRGDKISASYKRGEIVGKYAYINHLTNDDAANVKQPQEIELRADGTIVGAATGKWTRELKADGSYYYATVEVGGTVYHGVFFRQYQSKDDPEEVMTFTAIGSNNCTIWGVRTGDAADQAKADSTADIKITDPEDKTEDNSGTTTDNTGNTEKTTKTAVPAKGKTSTVSGAVYKVTKSAASGGTVEFQKPSKKSVKKVTVPATVKINGYTFKVTSVAASACSGCKKVKTLVVGTNVTRIGKKAFYNCSKLKTVTIKAKKISSMGKNSFAKIGKKAKIKVPSAKKKAYKKLLKKAGITGKNQKITS